MSGHSPNATQVAGVSLCHGAAPERIFRCLRGVAQCIHRAAGNPLSGGAISVRSGRRVGSERALIRSARGDFRRALAGRCGPSSTTDSHGRMRKLDLRSQPCSRSSVVAAVLGCVLLAGVAACGSRRDDRAGTVNTACATAAPGVTQDGINLGLLYSGSGFGSDPSTLFRAGIDARLDEQNAKGGMNGRKITYSFRDDESVPELNLVAGRDLAEHGNVLSILQFSVAPSGSAALLEQQGVRE